MTETKPMATKLVSIPIEGLSPNVLEAAEQLKSRYGKELQEAAKLLMDGEVVAFPTETVYGLGGNALNTTSAQKIYQAKGRPSDNPLIVHVACGQQIEEIAEVSPLAKRLIEAFCPGPLTLVLPKKACIPSAVSGGLATVGVRIPCHPVALALLQACKLPIAAPSANLSGKPSPTTGLHVFKDLGGKISMVIDSGKAGVGLESTVLDLTAQTPVILRPGQITPRDLLPFCGKVLLAGASMGDTQAPKAPGMKYGHYAPRGRVEIYTSAQLQAAYEQAKQESLRPKIALLVTADLEKNLTLGGEDVLYVLGKDEQDLQGVAKEIFGALRYCDDVGAELILVERFGLEGIGQAIMNRLDKAAASKNNENVR